VGVGGTGELQDSAITVKLSRASGEAASKPMWSRASVIPRFRPALARLSRVRNDAFGDAGDVWESSVELKVCEDEVRGRLIPKGASAPGAGLFRPSGFILGFPLMKE
jgi:hypothetical protein